MSRIHITLVGKQAAPVYNGILATSPDRVAYIYSTESSGIVERIKNAVPNISCDELPPLDPTDPAKINERIRLLAERYKNDEITLNISSGLKSWSHLFGIAFDKLPNATVVYMDQNNVLWNYKTMKREDSDFSFDMRTLFSLYGNPLEKYVPYTDYTPEDDAAAQKVEGLRRFAPKEFNAILTGLSKENKNKITQKMGEIASADRLSTVSWVRDNQNKDETVKIHLSKKGKTQDVILESPHAVPLAFNAGWFEYKAAKMLSKWPRSKEILMNCQFPLHQERNGASSGKIKNEVDIIVNAGMKLLFVECKTQINTSTDIDKFRSVVKHYGGMGSKGLFITDAVMNEMNQSKCRDYGLLSFSFSDTHMGLPSEKALFMLLESELFNINME